jgi:hypothetical protein
MPSWTIKGNLSGNLNMSGGTSASFTSSSFSSNVNQNGQISGQQTTQTTQTDRDGNTTVHRAHQNHGQPCVEETRSFDRHGRQQLVGEVEEASERRIEGGSNESTGGPTIEDVTDEQAEKDREYEEKMEDEYAKREGGA